MHGNSGNSMNREHIFFVLNK